MSVSPLKSRGLHRWAGRVCAAAGVTSLLWAGYLLWDSRSLRNTAPAAEPELVVENQDYAFESPDLARGGQRILFKLYNPGSRPIRVVGVDENCSEAM